MTSTNFPEDYINSIYYDGEGFIYLTKFSEIRVSKDNKGIKYFEFEYLEYNEPYDKNEFIKPIFNYKFSIETINDSPKTNLGLSSIDNEIIYVSHANSPEEALKICKGYLLFQ